MSLTREVKDSFVIRTSASQRRIRRGEADFSLWNYIGSALSVVCVLTVATVTLLFNEPSAEAAQRSQCEIGAFVQESDPAGLNVRAAPNAGAKVLGTLAPIWVDREQGYRTRAEVDVIASQGGWFLIRNGRDNPDMTGRAERSMYQGEGWVSGSRLVVKSQSNVGRAKPRHDAPEVTRLRDGGTFDNDAMIDGSRLVGCQGPWAQVEFTDSRLRPSTRQALRVDPSARHGLPSGHFRVWMDKICGVQETSCDGLGGNEP